MRRTEALIALVLLTATPGCRPELPPPGTPPGPALSLEPAEPNPFSTATRIRFELGESLFEDGGEVRVSMEVFNLLHQAVAVPVAEEQFAAGRPIVDLAYPAPGLYAGIWDGTLLDGRPAAAGPYFVQVSSGDQKAVGKLLLSR